MSGTPYRPPHPTGLRLPLLVSVLVISLLVLTAIASLARHNRPGIAPPAYPVFGYSVPGLVFNRLTGERLTGARLDCGVSRATSDAYGHFTISLLTYNAPNRCRVELERFETTDVEARVGRNLGVWLTPDPITTVDSIIEWERQRRYGEQYDLLYPDVRRSWTREEFTRLLSETPGRRIVAVEHAAPVFLSSWDYYGDLYADVFLVPTWITYEQDGTLQRVLWEAHLVKRDGLWRWFREPDGLS